LEVVIFGPVRCVPLHGATWKLGPQFGEADFIMSSYFIEIMDYELERRAEKPAMRFVFDKEKFRAAAR
jgi:hypothetical protein